MEEKQPRVVLFGGSNGSGKTTTAIRMLRGEDGIKEFVNADVIARGLSYLNPDRVALKAGRIMLDQIQELASQRVSFAFESTLASRTFAPWLRSLVAIDFEFHLYVIWVPSAEFSITRVAQRVALGGHFVPDDTVRRRYAACFRNFFELYKPIATKWTVLNNSCGTEPSTVATGGRDTETRIADSKLWHKLVREYGDEYADEI